MVKIGYIHLSYMIYFSVNLSHLQDIITSQQMKQLSIAIKVVKLQIYEI